MRDPVTTPRVDERLSEEEIDNFERRLRWLKDPPSNAMTSEFRGRMESLVTDADELLSLLAEVRESRVRIHELEAQLAAK